MQNSDCNVSCRRHHSFILFLHCTKVLFASFLSGGFTTMAVMKPPESKLAKCTSVHWLHLQRVVSCHIIFTKSELLQLNRTQFPSLGIFVSINVGNRKN